jgi:hypothetical protein
MDKGGVLNMMIMLMFVWFVIMETTIAMDTITGSSMKKPHIHHDDFVGRKNSTRVLKENSQVAQNQQKMYADRHRVEHNFEVGDLVILRLQPYRQSSLNKSGVEKPKPLFYGPYRVIMRVGEVAYELELPEGRNIHNIFHVFYLKKAFGQQVTASMYLPPLDEEGKLVLAPERIVDVRE